jgi:hypothetical protein
MSPDQSGPEGRLDYLLVRYWANEPSADEADELSRLLADGAAADDQIEAFCLQTLVAAELRSGARQPRTQRRPVGRRLVLAGVAAGFAAAVAAWLGWPAAPRAPATPVLARSSGTVRVHGTGAARLAEAGLALGAGQTVSTFGLDASAVLAYPDGTAVVLTGDTVATVGGAQRLTVRRGAVSAEVATVPSEGSFTLATAEGHAVADGGAKLSLTRTSDQTEVGVTQGRVHVTDASGDSLVDMGRGEVATIDTHGSAQKRNAPRHAPDEYAWDLSRPLPSGWELGQSVPDALARPFGRAVAPALWADKFIRRTCWQIRSDNRWAQGLFQIHPDTSFQVRYKVDRPGTGQLLVVIREDPAMRDRCNVLLAPVPFEPAADGGWRTVELAASDWEVEQNRGWRPPPGPQPWLAYLVVFNTYEIDLGLRVAEFSVTRPKKPLD